MEDRSRQHGILKFIICGGVIFAFAMWGAFVLVDSMAASDPYPTSTVQIARHGSACQRLLIDNATAAIKSSEPIPCGDAPKQVPASIQPAPSHYSSGGRIDAIRDSFRSR